MGILRLTIRSESRSQSFRFSKNTLILGDGPPENIDILLPNMGLKETHVKILNLADKYTLVNVANDPFVTLNGFPFGKKTLKVGDVLQIREVEIDIDGFDEGELTTEEVTAVKSIPEALPSVLPVETFTAKPTSPAFDDLSAMEIESFLVDVQDEPELIFKPSTSIFPQTSKRKASPKETYGKLSLKDDPFHENEEEPKLNAIPKPQVQGWFWKVQWKYFAWGLTLLFVISGLIASEIYLRVTTLSKEEEMRAAEGVADIAMALTYAQLHQVNPADQNWSDPEFLRHSMLAILSPKSISSNSIMGSSQTSNGPYILRIYTSYDLSRFLVVAQPTPSLMQLWIPKHAIVVDSQMMYLRKAMDFKALNKFLAYPNPLDESHAAELDQLLASGVLLPLSDLAESTNNQEFMPPKALAFLRPGAENKIYNAPRYHEFGEAVLLHALARKDLPNSSDEDWVDDELEQLAILDNFVLYVPEKVSQSPNASDLFSSIPLEGKFLLGYLHLTADGKIKSSHLMMQNDHVWNHHVEADSPHGTDWAYASSGTTDFIHMTPLAQEMVSLATGRKEGLKELKDKISAELEKHISENTADSVKQVSEWIDAYELLSIRNDLFIKEALKVLKSKYQDITNEEFFLTVKETGLKPFFDDADINRNPNLDYADHEFAHDKNN